MIKNILLFAFLIFCKISLQAQAPIPVPTASIKGMVIDSVSNKPQDYITIALKKENITLKTALSGADGTFNLNKVEPGKYDLIIVAVGFKSKTIRIEINADQVKDLGKINIASTASNLTEVNITAAKPIIKQEIDRITYDMQADPESKVNNVLDMMRKIPLLSVDGDDNIKLKGSGSYKILINGKPSSLVARNPSDVFKNMSAADIEKIEVITTPPAKYDSEGLAGIINIITKKNIEAGYKGGLTLRDAFPSGGLGGSGNITVKEGKFGISAFFGLGGYKNPGTTSGSSRVTTGDAPSVLSQDGIRTYEGHYKYGNAELSYEIDTLNLITGEFSYNPAKDNNTSSRNSSLLQDAIVSQGYKVSTDGLSKTNSVDIGLNYQHNFKSNKEQLLTISYKLTNYVNSNLFNLDIQNRINYDPTIFPMYNQFNEETSREHTFQADYLHPVNKKLNIEGGIKAILRNNSSDYVYNIQNPSGEYVFDPSRSNNYINHQNVFGAYNSYQYSLKDWGFKAGIRAEFTLINADFISQSTNLDKHFFNLIPTFAVNRKFKSMSINFGYTQRIERPVIYQLNPFIDRSNPSFVSSGNPDLKPVLNNNFDLSISSFKKGSITVGLNYSFANNTVQQVVVYDQATQVTLSTLINTGKDRKFGTNFNISYPFTPKLNFTMGGNMNYVWLQGLVNGVDFKNDGLQGYFYTNLGYKLVSLWRFGLNYSYSTPWIGLQRSSTHNSYSSFSASKELIKDKLTLSGNASNPFQKFVNRVTETTGTNFVQNTYYQNYYRRFQVSLNWRFGKLKSDLKKNQRGINNDDTKGKSGSN